MLDCRPLKSILWPKLWRRLNVPGFRFCREPLGPPSAATEFDPFRLIEFRENLSNLLECWRLVEDVSQLRERFIGLLCIDMWF